MQLARIRSLLTPFLGNEQLSQHQIEQVSHYLDLLLKWNVRINLTSVREPDAIIQRHFGESLFLAQQLLGPGSSIRKSIDSAIDLGSGAGFPGLPLKIYAPQIRLSLIESNAKKATFLKEVARALELTNVNVMNARAETLVLPVARSQKPAAGGQQPTADLVTMRAVERFDESLPLAARLLAKNGTLALLIGSTQIARAHELLPKMSWSEAVTIPLSQNRILLLGKLLNG